MLTIVRSPFAQTLAASVFFCCQAFAQDTSVPAQYQPLYSELQSSMQSVEGGLQAGTPGQTNFIYSAEALTINGNIGLGLLKPGTRNAYLREMQNLQSIGVKGINLSMGFPLLYQPFYDAIGASQDYPQMLAFWQQVIRDAHSMGLKVIVETESLFPGYYTSAAGFNLSAYFPTLSLQQFEQGRAAQALVIYNEVKPDYLDLGSEPDTEARNASQPALLDPATWAQSISTYVQAIPAGSHNPPLGAGVGNWRTNDGIQFVQAEAAVPGLDYIDLHCYPVVNIGGVNSLQYYLQLIDAAHAAGKPVASSEYWLLKISSSGSPDNSQNPTTASLNAYSFFQPLDQEFLTDMWKIANQSNFIYGSAFWSRFFWSYLPYPTAPAPGAALNDMSQQVANVALTSNQKDGTALQVQALTGAPTPVATVASSANYAMTVSVGSLASVFGSNLASTTGSASSAGTSLDGVTVSVKDSGGTTQSAIVLFVSPSQVNFAIPTGLATGEATVTVSSSSGTASTQVDLFPAAPGVFSANGSGSGIAAAQVVRVDGSGRQVYTNTAGSCGGGACGSIPISLSNGPAYLVLYGTGISGGAQSGVTATIDGVPATVIYAGPQGSFTGLDQVNILIPTALAGVGYANVVLTTMGLTSNPVTINIQ